MKKNFVAELRWRGMLHDVMPKTEELLQQQSVCGYLGIDPTADSLHIGHLVGVMMLRHLQECGHKPIALIGGATGMIGDPSMKSAERNLLSIETLRHNQESIKKQLSKFLDFESKTANCAELVNNYDWMCDYKFLDFIRDIGKHITVNYMMAKDSVKKRITAAENSDGLSFTEFTYQLLQGYDFLHLYRTKQCRLQVGGSDQWGNITTGTELIRRIDGGEAYALTCKLITKADGGKFGKTEKGNIWLDKRYTSPYEFYQFWLNTSDSDAEKYIKIFTIFDQQTIEGLVQKHQEAPHLRTLQKELAKALTIMVHSEQDYETAVNASAILFGNATLESLQSLDETTFLQVFEGVPMYDVSRNDLPLSAMALTVDKTPFLPSRGECKKLIIAGGLSINKQKIENPEQNIEASSLLNDKYILLQKGKKNYAVVVVS